VRIPIVSLRSFSSSPLLSLALTPLRKPSYRWYVNVSPSFFLPDGSFWLLSPPVRVSFFQELLFVLASLSSRVYRRRPFSPELFFLKLLVIVLCYLSWSPNTLPLLILSRHLMRVPFLAVVVPFLFSIDLPGVPPPSSRLFETPQSNVVHTFVAPFATL